MANVLVCVTVGSKFEFQSGYYVPFRVNISFEKSWIPKSSQLWVKRYYYCSSLTLALAKVDMSRNKETKFDMPHYWKQRQKLDPNRESGFIQKRVIIIVNNNQREVILLQYIINRTKFKFEQRRIICANKVIISICLKITNEVYYFFSKLEI